MQSIRHSMPRRSRCAGVRVLAAAIALASAPALTGCVTVAEFRKLEDEVWALKQGRGGAVPPGERGRLADMGAQMDALESEVRSLRGEVEVMQHQVEEALAEAQAARRAAAGTPGSTAAVTPGADAPLGDGPEDAAQAAPSGSAPPAPEAEPTGATSAEVAAYRDARAAWSAEQYDVCIDRFKDFLQTYPSSVHADSAAFWLADCYYRQGEYETAVLRFDDVVARFPDSNRAPDALYRQGEALLRMGPRFGKAAAKAFERVKSEYPDSERAPEAQRQLDLLGAG